MAEFVTVTQKAEEMCQWYLDNAPYTGSCGDCPFRGRNCDAIRTGNPEEFEKIVMGWKPRKGIKNG